MPRTDQASFDYTDDPNDLATRFTAEKLREAIAEAEEDAEACGVPATQAMLKFDYEEWVPLENVKQALILARRQRSALFPRGW